MIVLASFHVVLFFVNFVFFVVKIRTSNIGGWALAELLPGR
jgi:hypothetical protein